VQLLWHPQGGDFSFPLISAVEERGCAASVLGDLYSKSRFAFEGGPRIRPGRWPRDMAAKRHPRGTRRVNPSIGRLSEVEPDRVRGLHTDQKDLAESRLLIATLRARLPGTTGIGEFTSRHPEVSIEVLNRSDVSKDVSVSDYWISGQPPGVWAREIATYPDVLKVDCLTEVGNGSLYRITFRNPPIIPLFRVLGVPIHFPLRIQGGFIRWEVVARRSEAQAILAHFRKTDSDFQVVSIRREPLRSHLPMLTETQDELLAQAMAAGYFAVPRGITLTGLASRLGRSKSSLSEMMANIEKKLLESALNSTSLWPESRGGTTRVGNSPA